MVSRFEFSTKLPILLLIFLTLFFCIFVIRYENKVADQAEQRLAKHAKLISDNLWNFNLEGATEYLRLAAEADNYLALEVKNKNGELFKKITRTNLNDFERLLITMGFNPVVKHVAEVKIDTRTIGWIEAVWIPRTYFLEMYVFLFLALVHFICVLYMRLHTANMKLEERVEERTKELVNTSKRMEEEYLRRIEAQIEQAKLRTKLEQSRKMESLGLLAGGVAHDLNNVLSGLVTYPDFLLLELEKDSPLREDIEIIRDSGIRAAEIVQDLLSLTRRALVKKRPLDLIHLLEEYLTSPEHTKIMAASPGTKIVKKIGPDTSIIMGSATPLKKVIMNLVSNAAEAQPQGGTITLEVSTIDFSEPTQFLQKVDAGRYAVLSVRDQGEGVSGEDLPKIFEPFFSQKVMGRSGTGLGLTVVWGTIEDHYGAIDVESEVGTGTTLHIYLPTTSEEPAPIEDHTQIPETSGGGQSILIVDDEENQRKIGSSALSKMGYRVQTVESGEKAIELLKTENFDLLLLDMVLKGGIDGLDTYKSILEFRPNQKTIVVSGYSESERVKEINDLGVNICIQKPYTLDEMSAAVSKVLPTGK